MRDFAPGRRIVLFLALLAGCSLLPGAAAQEKVYVKLPGLDGDSTDPAHPNWVEAYSLSYGRELVSGGGGGGGGSGTLEIRELTFIKGTDRASPYLLQGVAGGPAGVLATITIEVCREVPTQECYYRLDLSPGFVSRVAQTGSTCIDPGSCATGTTESVTLVFDRIRWTFIPFSAGKALTPIETCWSTVTQLPDCPQ